jgi:hypothetical protein
MAMAIIWPISFTIALSGTKSSLTPITNTINRGTRKNFILDNSARSFQMMVEQKKPQNIAMPPIEGVIFLWIFLRPGISTRFLLSEYLITTGRIKKENMKAVTVDATRLAIGTICCKIHKK